MIYKWIRYFWNYFFFFFRYLQADRVRENILIFQSVMDRVIAEDGCIR